MTSEASRLLVPVAESVTFRNTVSYALHEAERLASETSERAVVHFVYPAAGQADLPALAEVDAEARELLERVRVWARDDLGEEGMDSLVDVETVVIGTDTYLFSPSDYARVLLDYARANDIHRFILDPEYQPGATAPMLSPLEFELDQVKDVEYEEAPVERPAQRVRLVTSRGSAGKFVTVFGLAYLFYLVLGGFSGLFDVITGAMSAAVVAGLLYRVTFTDAPHPINAPRTVVRLFVYAFYLLWEIAKANLIIAYVVLHPNLPIDPRMERFRAAVWGGLPVTTLANSITLTPGTLTVDVRQREFHVHTLTRAARRDLLDGALERAVRFVFYGRSAAQIPSPRERRTREEETG